VFWNQFNTLYGYSISLPHTKIIKRVTCDYYLSSSVAIQFDMCSKEYLDYSSVLVLTLRMRSLSSRCLMDESNVKTN